MDIAQIKDSEVKQYIVFKIGEDEYGIDSLKITTIDRMKPITRVPKTPSYIKGVINLRGDIIPVMDLRLKFDLEEISETEETRIIILKLEEGAFGVIVDQVVETVQLEETQIESTANLFNGSISDYILGIGKFNSNIVRLLNFEKMIKFIE